MKKFLTIALALIFAGQYAVAEDNVDNGGYERMFKDGRQWITMSNQADLTHPSL